MPTFQPRVGEPVLFEGRRCRIKVILSLTRCVLQPDEVEARPLSAALCDLHPVPESLPARGTPEAEEFGSIPDKRLELALHRLEIIRPVLAGTSRAEVNEIAKANAISVATIYRLVKKFRGSGLAISLAPQYHLRGRPLMPRIPKELEEIITAAIEELYLNPNRPSQKEIWYEVAARCLKKKLKPPAQTTVRNRILALDAKVTTRARLGRNAAKRHEALRGTLPGADGPWSIIHIDHTEMGIIVVDRVLRRSIRRAHITIAEDAATRVVVGYYVSLEAPSQFSTGLCLVNAILPKEQWMAKRGIRGEWPVWGKPKIIHTDNGDGFRGETLQRACKEMDIEQHFRRIGHPEDGGRVERLIGTIERELHKLPGSTFSNPQQRGEYNSENEAVMTLDELETWIGNFIVNIYHQRPHRGLGGKSPIKAWEDKMLGGNGLPGLDLPERETDLDKLRLAFLPGKNCTVQRNGLTLDYITYMDDSLKRWIGVKKPDNPNRSLEFWVQRDPRDISRVWFNDPELKQRIEVPYRDMTRPVLNLWELKEIEKHLRAEGYEKVNEELIFTAREHLKQLVAGSAAATKTARRQQERKQRHQDAVAELPASNTAPAASAASPAAPKRKARSTPPTPYEDIEN